MDTETVDELVPVDKIVGPDVEIGPDAVVVVVSGRVVPADAVEAAVLLLS